MAVASNHNSELVARRWAKALMDLAQEDGGISKEEILNADKLLFPGQGHFEQAMNNLEKSGLIETIKQAIDKGIDFLGICLGLQILFEKSEEAPNKSGLGILKGEVKKFDIAKSKEVHRLTTYAYKVANLFHSLYNEVKFIDEENPSLTSERLALVKATSVVLKNALNLLGVEVKETM